MYAEGHYGTREVIFTHIDTTQGKNSIVSTSAKEGELAPAHWHWRMLLDLRWGTSITLGPLSRVISLEGGTRRTCVGEGFGAVGCCANASRWYVHYFVQLTDRRKHETPMLLSRSRLFLWHHHVSAHQACTVTLIFNPAAGAWASIGARLLCRSDP